MKPWSSPIAELLSLCAGLPMKSIWKLQSVQNDAARLLTWTAWWNRITPILQELHCSPVCVRVQFKVLVMTFKGHVIWTLDQLLPYALILNSGLPLGTFALRGKMYIHQEQGLFHGGINPVEYPA